MTKAETQSSEGGLTRALAREAGAWVLLALIWAPLLWRLARMWRSETEQMFGFGVPLLVAWLLWQRRGEWTQPAAPGRGAWWLAAAGAGLLGLALLALEANPLWPKAAWLGAGGALILTFAVIARGHGWRGVKASAPMWLLMLTALKWPAFIYEPVMRTMMQMNAVIAAELVNLFGTPAMVQGNVIEVAHGMVGVDEACSGLRSLQTVIMMALFLGELDRLRVRSRLALLVGAVLAALAVNVARTTVLTWVFANKGPAVEERWHDPAGVVALLVTLALVWLWSERLNQRGGSAVVMSPANIVSKGPALGGLAWRPLAAAVFAVVTIEAGTQAWYLSHERHVASRISWSLKTETDSGWVRVEVPRRSAEMLQYESSESFGRELRNPSRQMLAFAFRWEADMARMGTPEQHDPLVCLPTVGAVQEAELPEARVVVEGVEVPFRFIRFRQGALNQHVWFCLWGTRLGEADAERWQGGDISKKRWERVRAGLRNDEREQLIFFVQGEADDAGAEATLRDAVLTLLSRR